ncbi:Hypothetical predicted protein [Podarcis lilfordi]|uniref:Uncharacterized protein n=1 Tax=Podarcis lilfordi TaxID=74358 RepID=A0AA35L0A6_9SAUR|nr:Hypothetical predicted protein [Podarcis lilfordi]
MNITPRLDAIMEQEAAPSFLNGKATADWWIKAVKRLWKQEQEYIGSISGPPPAIFLLLVSKDYYSDQGL